MPKNEVKIRISSTMFLLSYKLDKSVILFLSPAIFWTTIVALKRFSIYMLITMHYVHEAHDLLLSR